ncbi:hypothetical protein QTJ16_004194 [Diplocarpon rosae]|uniref:Uncharacterized protein n=1 Tax=Diplocarpon rosae TaxID=946125 RepID=A0AAD9WFG6_9HELO|nr:hypothetical protein QTJ16_004194 [Diplocarpon rosae]
MGVSQKRSTTIVDIVRRVANIELLVDEVAEYEGADHDANLLTIGVLMVYICWTSCEFAICDIGLYLYYNELFRETKLFERERKVVMCRCGYQGGHRRTSSHAISYWLNLIADSIKLGIWLYARLRGVNEMNKMNEMADADDTSATKMRAEECKEEVFIWNSRLALFTLR